MKSIKYIVVLVGLMASLTACQGDAGVQGPAGLIGPKGKDGADGSLTKGITGDKGVIGDKGATGDQGVQPTLTAVSSPWFDYKTLTVSTITSTTDFIVLGRNDFSLSSLLSVGVVPYSNVGADNSAVVTDKSVDGKIIGTLYFYHKIQYAGREAIFGSTFLESKMSLFGSIIGSNSTVGSAITAYLPKLSFAAGSKVDEAIALLATYKPAVRYVYLPIELTNGRKMSVDMTDYEAVKKAYNLKD